LQNALLHLITAKATVLALHLTHDYLLPEGVIGDDHGTVLATDMDRMGVGKNHPGNIDAHGGGSVRNRRSGLHLLQVPRRKMDQSEVRGASGSL